MKRIVWVLALAFFAQGEAVSSQIPLVGMNVDGNALESSLERAQYTSRVEALISSTTEKTLPALERLSQKGKWQVHTVVVGIGINFEIGLDKIASLNITPRMRFAFSRHQDPIVP